MSAEQYAELMLRHMEAENDHRMNDTLATLTTDCVFEDTTLKRTWHGRRGAADYYEMWWTAFDVVVAGERLHYDGGATAVAETVWRGTHVGPFLGIAPTGREIELAVAVFVDLRDGLMAGERFYWDKATLLEQLGAQTALRVNR